MLYDSLRNPERQRDTKILTQFLSGTREGFNQNVKSPTRMVKMITESSPSNLSNVKSQNSVENRVKMIKTLDYYTDLNCQKGLLSERMKQK